MTDRWSLAATNEGVGDTFTFESLAEAVTAQDNLLQRDASLLPREVTPPVFTPLDPTRRARLLFKQADVLVLSGDLDVRRTGKKARVRIGARIWDVYGRACSLTGCNCDAYIREVTGGPS